MRSRHGHLLQGLHQARPMTSESRNWLMLAILAAGGWLVYLLAPVITPFAISAVLAYFGDPIVDRLEKVSIWRWKVGRSVAVSIVFVLLLSLLTVIFLIIMEFSYIKYNDLRQIFRFEEDVLDFHRLIRV